MNYPKRITPTTATRRGFIVDTHCYPWFAYKGPRFAPTESRWCYTDLETDLLRKLKRISNQRKNSRP